MFRPGIPFCCVTIARRFFLPNHNCLVSQATSRVVWYPSVNCTIMSFKGTWIDVFADWVQEPGARDKGLKTAQYVIKLALLQAGACKDVSRGEFAMKSPLHAIAAATGSPAAAGTMAVAIRSQEGWMKPMASAISMSRKVVLLGDSIGDFVDTVEAAREFVASPSTSAGLALLRAAGDLACDACTEAATIAKMTGRKSVRLLLCSSF